MSAVDQGKCAAIRHTVLDLHGEGRRDGAFDCVVFDEDAVGGCATDGVIDAHIDVGVSPDAIGTRQLSKNPRVRKRSLHHLDSEHCRCGDANVLHSFVLSL